VAEGKYDGSSSQVYNLESNQLKKLVDSTLFFVQKNNNQQQQLTIDNGKRKLHFKKTSTENFDRMDMRYDPKPNYFQPNVLSSSSSTIKKQIPSHTQSVNWDGQNFVLFAKKVIFLRRRNYHNNHIYPFTFKYVLGIHL